MFRDLQNLRWIIAKGVLFLLAGIMASTLLLAEVWSHHISGVGESDETVRQQHTSVEESISTGGGGDSQS